MMPGTEFDPIRLLERWLHRHDGDLWIEQDTEQFLEQRDFADYQAKAQAFQEEAEAPEGARTDAMGAANPPLLSNAGKRDTSPTIVEIACPSCDARLVIGSFGVASDRGALRSDDPRRTPCSGRAEDSPLHAWMGNRCFRCGIEKGAVRGS